MSSRSTSTEIFDRLDELSEVIPEMRIAQLVAAIGEVCADLHGRGLWEASDAEFLEAIWQFRRNYESSVASSASMRKSE